MSELLCKAQNPSYKGEELTEARHELLLSKGEPGLPPTPTFKGDFLETRADGTRANHGWEGLPLFIYIEMPGELIGKAVQYEEPWHLNVRFNIIYSDKVTDTYRISISAKALATSKKGALVRNNVEQLISDWNGIIQTVGSNQVDFDLNVFNAIKADSFWGVDASKIVFSELNYDEATGIHTIEADYSALNNNPTYIERHLLSKVDSIISHAAKKIVFTVARSTVKQEVETYVSKFSEKTLKKRKWYLPSGVVDNIVAQGGVATSNLALLKNFIKNRLDD